MTPELTEKLKTKHPKFFVDLYGDPTKTCMTWGLECGDGWYDLIEKLCDDIAAADPPEDFRFAQIKEKFGGLRVYVDSGNDKIFDLIDAAEEESYKVCESCGTRENVSCKGVWISTLCDSCRGG